MLCIWPTSKVRSQYIMTLMSLDSAVYSARRYPSPATKHIVFHVHDLGARECIF